MNRFFTYLLALALALALATCTAYSQETIDKLSIDPGLSYQTIEGFGAALAYYEGWVNAHPKKDEIYEAIFGELSLDILRVRNAYVYDPDMIGRVKEYMTAAEASLGHPIKLLSSSWAPTDTLKNTGDRKHGGTLRYEIVDSEVKFDYAGFAQWWNGALDEYETNGVLPDYISFQNEPDWSADYESCLFKPTEVINSTDTIASYSKALDAIYDMVQAREKKPMILGPETVGIGYNSVQNYVNALDVTKLDAIAHHLYHGVNENNPYASNEFANLGSFHPEIPHFQTEFSRGDWFSLAGLIYKSFYEEKVEAYLYWDLVWPDGGLVSIKNPWQSSVYSKTKEFYAFKQFSAFIHPGWKMVKHSMDSNISASLTFVSPGLDSAACVIINRSFTADIPVHMDIPGYRIHQSAIYTTSDSENCLLKGALMDSILTVGAHSITTIDMRIEQYDPADDTEAPTVPSIVSITGASDVTLSLLWNASVDNIGVEGYHLYLDGSFYGSTKDTFMIITGLAPWMSYEIAVSAFDYVPNESGLSEPVSGSTFFYDEDAPLVLATDSIYQEGDMEVTSSEDGMIYLVPGETPNDLAQIRTVSMDSLEVMAETAVVLFLSGLDNGEYWVYATDSAINISEPAKVGIYGVGVQDLSISNLILFPNPFSESAHLSFFMKEDQPIWFRMIDSQGREVMKEYLGRLSQGPQQHSIQGRGMAPGLYFFRLETLYGEGQSGRLMIRD